jgi:hypothetical protein
VSRTSLRFVLRNGSQRRSRPPHGGTLRNPVHSSHSSHARAESQLLAVLSQQCECRFRSANSLNGSSVTITVTVRPDRREPLRRKPAAHNGAGLQCDPAGQRAFRVISAVNLMMIDSWRFKRQKTGTCHGIGICATAHP